MINKQKTFLFVFAHPDDETSSSGGTITKLSKEGHSVYVCTSTRGELGTLGTGTLKISADAEHPNTLSLTGKGKYGLRPNQLKFGNDKQLTLTTDSSVTSYLLVTEFRRN